MDNRASQDKLHSEKDNQLEVRDQRIFARVVIWAGAAMLVVFVLALLLVRRVERHIQPVTPNNHPTSRLVQVSRQSLA